EHDRLGVLETDVAHVDRNPGDVRGEGVALLLRHRAGAEVDVVRAQGDPGELRVGVGVLDREAPTGQHRLARRRGQTASGDRRGAGPRARLELTGLRVAHQRGRQSIGLAGPGERETVLVGDPLLVDLRVVAGEATHDLPATVVDADRGAGGVV